MKQPRIAVENLALELTRKCNLKCGHCMRGKCENKEMSNETIDKIFEEIDSIGLLEFVGGESSLAIDRINQVVESIKKHKTLVHNVLVFTNAVNITEDFIKALKNLESIANDDGIDYSGFIKRYEKEGKYPLKIVVSLDKFHLESMKEGGISKEKVKANIEMLAENFPVEIDKMCNYTIYDEGHGIKIKDMYKFPVPIQKYCFVYREYDNLLIVGPLVAISQGGKLVEANRSYEYNDKFGIGNINNESILSMFVKLNKERGIKKCKDTKSFYKYMDKYLHIFSSTTREIQKMMKYYMRRKQKIDYKYFDEEIPSYEELKIN